MNETTPYQYFYSGKSVITLRSLVARQDGKQGTLSFTQQAGIPWLRGQELLTLRILRLMIVTKQRKPTSGFACFSYCLLIHWCDARAVWHGHRGRSQWEV